MNQDDTETLISRAVNGDAVALTVLLTEDYQRLRRYLSGKIASDLRSVLDPEDIIQEAHADAFRQIASFEARGPDSLQRWVTTIAVRKLRNAVKMYRAHKRGGGAGQLPGQVNVEESMVQLLELLNTTEHTPSRSVARHEAVATLQAAISELPEDYRRAVTLIHLEGRTLAEAADEMGRTETAVRNLCYKARNRLRDWMGSRSRFLSE